MKVLVFAHTPPPHHGQSYMVELMLAGLGGDHRKMRKSGAAQETGISLPGGASLGVECYHVNARFSRKLEDVGEFRLGKLLLLLGYCLEAIWCRWRYGVTTLYYIPAPGKRSALYRDWLVMLLCRPFFKRVILHWHAAGLAKWLETVVQVRSRALTYRLLRQVDLSIVLSNYNRIDADKLLPRHVHVVANGIPDPCPQFEEKVLPRRQTRCAARRKLLSGTPLTSAEIESCGGDPHLFKVLFLAHCTRQKGLFDTLDAVALANARLTQVASPIRLHLSVAGEFMSGAERREFEERKNRPDLWLSPEFATAGASAVSYKGFILGEEKERVLAESDCFCFPTHYYAESFGLVVIEAMAFGSPVVATRWRSIPELLPWDYCGLVDIRKPDQIAAALVALLPQDTGQQLRAAYLSRFTLDRHLRNLAAAFHSLEEPNVGPEPAAVTQGSAA